MVASPPGGGLDRQEEASVCRDGIPKLVATPGGGVDSDSRHSRGGRREDLVVFAPRRVLRAKAPRSIQVDRDGGDPFAKAGRFEEHSAVLDDISAAVED